MTTETDLCIDASAVEEAIMLLVDRMVILGFNGVEMEVDSGALASAVHDLRTSDQVELIEEYLKDLAQELLKEEKQVQGPELENIKEAKRALDECWKEFKACIE